MLAAARQPRLFKGFTKWIGLSHRYCFRMYRLKLAEATSHLTKEMAGLADEVR